MADLRTDHGPNPYVLDIEDVTTQNEAFRDTLWTGKFLQMTVMAIPAGGEIGGIVTDDALGHGNPQLYMKVSFIIYRSLAGNSNSRLTVSADYENFLHNEQPAQTRRIVG